MKILTISGGGLKGTGVAELLNLAALRGADINDFDLYSGSSVGSILAALYAAQVPPSIVRYIMVGEGAKLFTEKSLWQRLRDPNKAKYDRAALYNRIEEVLAKYNVVYMKDLKKKLMITTFGLWAKKTHFICSWDKVYQNLKVVDVVAWSALSAANYFGKIVVSDFPWINYYQVPVPVDMKGEVFQDGGQGIHNYTCLDSILTAIYGLGEENIRELSIGCGSPLMMAEKIDEVTDDGWFQQVKGAIFTEAGTDAIVDQVETADYILRKKFKESGHFCHINPIIPEKIDVLDGKKFIDQYVQIFAGEVYKLPPWLFNR